MKPGYLFCRIGGRVALDFANTVGNVYAPGDGDHIASYDDLVTWGEQLDVLDRHAGKRLRALAAERPREAAGVLVRARALRAALQRSFLGTSAGRAPTPGDVGVVNDELVRALDNVALRPGDGVAARWSYCEDDGALDRMLWPVARDAAELLTSPELLARVRPCPSAACGWLFFDASKNNKRRWCDMAACGNRAKARRHYARAKAERGPSGAR